MATTWRITLKDGEQVDLPRRVLLEELLRKGMETERPDHESVSHDLLRFLEEKAALSECNPKQLALMAFDLGYYYKVFLTQNDVEVMNDSEAPEPGASDTRSSTDTSDGSSHH